MKPLILALDQGTTSSRAILFDETLAARGLGQHEFTQHFPGDGAVEHDPEDLWRTTLQAARDALAHAGADARAIAAIGIANQRETTLVWDRRSGKPIHRAVVWQDRRTAEECQRLRAAGYEPAVAAKTGLLLDPYFSATKIAWILDRVAGARAAAEAGHLAFGTVDSWLVWRLTGGAAHITDATNASRTLLFDIHRGVWDEDLLRLFRVPAAMLPEVRDCADDFGIASPDHLGAAVPILGIAGDQQAAAIGQACFTPGMMKATYGTGCFALVNTGSIAAASRSRLLTTHADQHDGERSAAREGANGVAGAAVQWLRDGIGVIGTASETDALAPAADAAQDVILVPAFVGLGAPHWRAEARGALFGLTRATGPAELARAALQAVAYQTRDLLDAVCLDFPGAARSVLRVDGGMAASDWTMQVLADVLDAPVDRPVVRETTALGAAWLAGRRAGLLPDQTGFARLWQCERRFLPAMSAAERERRLARWRRAVQATIAASGGA